MSPLPQEVFRGIRQQKRKKWNLKENKKTKRGGKKKKKRYVARIFRVLSLFKAPCIVVLCYTWFCTIDEFLTIKGA